MIRLGTLFSGIGAVEQALIRMNIEYEIVFACDNGDIEIDINEEEVKQKIFSMSSKKEKKQYIDDLYSSKSRKQNYVKQSYLANYKMNENDFYADVRFLDGRDYKGQIDLLVGGSPCQSFSSVGFRGGLDDVRGTLFYEYARIVEETQPKVFIYENVRGLTTHDDGKTWAKMKKVFTDTLHYRITEPEILNSADYGVPQNRRRLFVVGIRDDIKCKEYNYPKPIGADNLPFFVQDILEDNCKFDENKCNYDYDRKTGKIKITKEKGIVDKKYTLTPKVRDYCLKSGTKNFKTSTQIDLPIARTLLRTMTQHHRAGVDNYITVKELKTTKDIRSLTERECLRLMGYPDSFKIVVSTQQMMKQAGNSIVVDVMMAVLREVFNTGALD